MQKFSWQQFWDCLTRYELVIWNLWCSIIFIFCVIGGKIIKTTFNKSKFNIFHVIFFCLVASMLLIIVLFNNNKKIYGKLTLIHTIYMCIDYDKQTKKWISTRPKSIWPPIHFKRILKILCIQIKDVLHKLKHYYSRFNGAFSLAKFLSVCFLANIKHDIVCLLLKQAEPPLKYFIC